MPMVLPLEDFGAAGMERAKPKTAPPAGPTAAELQAQKLESYEQGYKAGWDDAIAENAKDQDRIGAEFARNLQDLGFTFHEARSHVMHAMEPLLTDIVAKVLPRLVTQTLGQTIIEELLPLAETAADAPIQVVVAPANRAALSTLLADAVSVPLELVEEPTLAEGQVYLRTGTEEHQIDLTGAVDRIGNAIRALYALNERAAQAG